MALVEIDHLTYAYGANAEKPRLRDCSLTIEAGEMVLVVGPSGCGKSTLLRAVSGLVPHFHGGTISGRVRVAGLDTRDVKPPGLAHIVASVFQDPEAQIVASTVFEEVVFGLESLGVDPASMPLRVHEALGAMGIAHLTERSTRELSGGETQRVALAAALAMRPALLVLDEPTSQLDPAAAEALLELLRRVNEDSGIAVLIAEHRLERCFHWADRVLVMTDGKIVSDATPRESARWSLGHGDPFVPPVARLFAGLSDTALPLTVKEGRAQLRHMRADSARDAAWQAPAEAHAATAPTHAGAVAGSPAPRPHAVALRGVRFSHPDGDEAVRGVSLTIAQGECVALMGHNGAGKTTLVRHLNGLNRPAHGTVALFGDDIVGVPVEHLARRCALLGQNPNDYLFCDSVADELRFSLRNLRPELDRDAQGVATLSALEVLGIRELVDANPRDLSAGQRQRVAIAAMTVARPEILVLDEPTRGLDWDSKATLGACLRRLQATGTTILIVTHDVEFAATFSDRTLVMGSGRLLADGPTADVMSSTSFIAPQVSKVLGDLAPGVVTVEAGREVLAEVVQRG